MRNTRIFVLTAAAALLATGCSGGERQNAVAAQAEEGVADEAAGSCSDVGEQYPDLEGQTLTIGSTPGLNYYNLVDESRPDEVIGLEPDLMRAVSECLGFEYTYQKTDFNGLIPALQSDRIDLITSGMYATEERAQEVSFVTYMNASQSAVVQQGNPSDIGGLEDLCGTTVAQVVGTVEVELAAQQNEQCLAGGQPAIETLDFTTNNQMVSALTDQRADVFLTDTGVAAYLADEFDGLEVGFDLVSDFRFGIGVGKDNEELLNGIHDALVAMHEDDQVVAIAEEWGFSADAVIDPEIVQ
ncbi:MULTISPECIES: ABC transporter substrate-binding protein [unclassified Geodermatophilus]